MRTQFKPAESLEFLFKDEFINKTDRKNSEEGYDKAMKVFVNYEDPAESQEFQEALDAILYGQ